MSNGSFVLNNLDTCPPHVLKFVFANYWTDYMVQPLSKYSNALDLSVQIDYPPTATKEQPRVPAKKSPAVRLLASSGSSGNSIVLVVSDNSLHGEGRIGLYALSGETVCSLPFTCLGVGTYTIALKKTDGNSRPVPATTYLCRITIGTELVCKSFFTH
jgi:hypothetical protein